MIHCFVISAQSIQDGDVVKPFFPALVEWGRFFNLAKYVKGKEVPL
jgi:hypothetical protein